jgi:hypothetical protein
VKREKGEGGDLESPGGDCFFACLMRMIHFQKKNEDDWMKRLCGRTEILAPKNGRNWKCKSE